MDWNKKRNTEESFRQWKTKQRINEETLVGAERMEFEDNRKIVRKKNQKKTPRKIQELNVLNEKGDKIEKKETNSISALILQTSRWNMAWLLINTFVKRKMFMNNNKINKRYW